MTETALLLIDIQTDFCPGGALAVTDGDAVVPVANALQARYPIRVLTQDWHPAGHGSFASSHAGATPFSLTRMPYGDQVLWPDHCVAGTPGAGFHPGLRTDAELILRKGFRPEIDSYSAFFENDRTTDTGLAAWLRARGAGAVALCGLATDFCVLHTALDARRLGFDVTLHLDACRGIDMDGSVARALEEMRGAGVVLA